MVNDHLTYKIQAMASELASSLVHHDRQAGIHLARLLLVDKSVQESVYRLFARALAGQLHRWPERLHAIGPDDVVILMRAAAHELLAERWDGDRDEIEKDRQREDRD